VTAVLCGGKRMADTKRKAFVGGIRHCDPAMCWQGALFRHLITMYTLRRTPFPTITDDTLWYNAAIWPLSSPTQNVDYDTLARQLSSLLAQLDINIGKVMHSFRVYAARYLDEQGLPDEVGVGITAVCHTAHQGLHKWQHSACLSAVVGPSSACVCGQVHLPWPYKL
jgi:hypothetical protein